MTEVSIVFIGSATAILAVAFGLHVLWWHNPRRKS